MQLLLNRGARWKDVFLAMFMVYIDDSGTDPQQHVAIATALIIPATRITALDGEWKRLTEKEGFTDFHMSVCVARNEKSPVRSMERRKAAARNCPRPADREKVWPEGFFVGDP